MPEAVIDASALLALLNAEAGADTVAEAIPGGIMSAVNLAEVVTKLADAGMPDKAIRQAVEPLGLEIMPFDEEQAYQAGLLYISTQKAGLSLGDRACLGLAEKLSAPALTADRAWAKLKTGASVKVIR